MGRVIPNLEVHQEEVLPDAAACVGQFRRNTSGLWWSDGIEWRRVDAPGGVQSVTAGEGVDVDDTDPANPKVSLDSATIASLALADTAVQNLFDLGVTATASELNVLDGITASTVELNYTSGVTGSIQAQLDGRMLWLGQVTDGVYDDHVVRSSAAAFFHAQGNAPSDRPISSQASVLHLGNTWGRAQLVFPNSGTNRVFVRTGTSTDWSEVYTTANFDPATKADVSHTHGIAQITGLQDALDGKQPAGSYAAASHTHTIADVSGLQSALDGKAASSHTHTIANVSGLQAALDGKAAASHTHGIAQVTGLQAALDGKAASSHTHTITDVSGLQAALDGKQPAGSYAAASHTHTIADVSGLQSALDGKAAASHSHSISDVSGLQSELNGRTLWLGQVSGGEYSDHVAQSSAAAFFHSSGGAPTDAPVSSQASVLHLGNTWGRAQMVFPNSGTNRVFVRTGTSTEWSEVYTTTNLDLNGKWDSSEATARGLTGTQGRTVTDWDELLGQGSQFIRGTGSAANAPFGNAAAGVYSSYNTQAGLVLAASGSQNEFYGRAASGGSWKDWRRFAMADELGLVPQRVSNAATTLTLADAGRHIYSGNNSNYTWTVPPNSSVAFPIGTVVSFVHGGSSGTKTVAQGSGVTFIHQDGSTGNVALTSTRRSATLLKVNTNTWLVS